jgi:hypothetical protein
VVRFSVTISVQVFPDHLQLPGKPERHLRVAGARPVSGGAFYPGEAPSEWATVPQVWAKGKLWGRWQDDAADRGADPGTDLEQAVAPGRDLRPSELGASGSQSQILRSTDGRSEYDWLRLGLRYSKLISSCARGTQRWTSSSRCCP